MTVDIEKHAPPQSEPDANRKSDILDLVGNGLWQKIIFAVLLAYTIPAATHSLSMSFLAPNLDHWCARPKDLNWTVDKWKSVALPQNDKHCSRYKSINFTRPYDENDTILNNEEIVSCHTWEYDTSFYKSTVLSEWDLVCDKQWLVSMSKSAFVIGNIISNVVFGHLSDTVGRKPALTVCCVIAVFSAILCGFSTSFVMFIITRFFISFGISGVYDVGFVLLMEAIGPEQRSFYGVAINFGWGFGFVTLPGVAWLLRDWFWIHMALTIPCVGLLGTWWFLPESPRWLMFKGRTDEARKELTRAAKMNGKEISDVDSKIRKFISTETEVRESAETQSNFLDLFRTPGLCQMTLNIYFMWFVNSFIYYGLSFNTNELVGDPFVNFALSGAVEFPAYFLTIYVIKSLGRRNPTAGFMIIGGIACLLLYIIPTKPVWISVVVSMTGKFCISCSFAIAYVYTTEIFPTVVRNIGLASASILSRFGSLISPFVRELGNSTHPVVPQLLFGILAFVSGVLVLLLPETNNCVVPDTVAEAAARRRQAPKKIGTSTEFLNVQENGKKLNVPHNGPRASSEEKCNEENTPTPTETENEVDSFKQNGVNFKKTAVEKMDNDNALSIDIDCQKTRL